MQNGLLIKTWTMQKEWENIGVGFTKTRKQISTSTISRWGSSFSSEIYNFSSWIINFQEIREASDLRVEEQNRFQQDVVEKCARQAREIQALKEVETRLLQEKNH